MKNLIYIILSLAVISCHLLAEKKINNPMEIIKNSKLYQIIEDAQASLYNRIKAIEELDLSKEGPMIIQRIKKILTDNRMVDFPTKNFDSNAAERIIDLYLIEVLNKLEDKTQNNRIPVIIAQSNQFLSNEHGNDLIIVAKVIQSINNNEVYADIVKLLKSTNEKEVKNAVFVLNKIGFPDAPTGGDTGEILPAKETVFRFHYLKEEMELYAKESEGKLVLSSGIQEYIDKNNYDRGQVELETTFHNILDRLSLFNFYYYTDEDKVIICTYKEAAERWINWWANKEYKI